MEVVALGVTCHRFRCLQGPSKCRREEAARDGKHDRHVPCLQGQPLVSHLLLCRAAIASSLDYFREKPDILIVQQTSSNFKREHLLTHFWNDRIGQKKKLHGLKLACGSPVCNAWTVLFGFLPAG